MKNNGLTIYLAGKMAGLSIEEQITWRKFVAAELDKYSDMLFLHVIISILKNQDTKTNRRL